MKRIILLTGMVLGVALGARAQGVVGDVFSGNLIKPEPGVYAWYDLKDTASDKTYYVRLAVVGEEKVEKKKGQWLETEVIPQLGFPAVYKMLLTGPASDTKNIHKIIVREGQHAPTNIPIEQTDDKDQKGDKEKRESLGKEKISTGQGEIEAEHVIITKHGPDKTETKVEVWLNDEVRPMGIVKMSSASGELALQRYGKGGPDGESHMNAVQQPSPDGTTPQSDVKVKVEGGVPVAAPDQKEEKPKETAVKADAPVEKKKKKKP